MSSERDFLTDLERAIGVTNSTPGRRARLADAIKAAPTPVATGLLSNSMPGLWKAIEQASNMPPAGKSEPAPRRPGT